MTTPDERKRALLSGYDLLEALAGRTLFQGVVETKPVARHVRELARRILRHHPTPLELEAMCDGRWLR